MKLAYKFFKFYEKIAWRVCGKIVVKFEDRFAGLRDSLRKANIHILFSSYLAIMLFTAIFCSTALFFIGLAYLLAIHVTSNAFLALASLSLAIFFFTLFIFYVYPYVRAKNRARSIDTNLPFAINHLAAIASANAPPDVMFRILAKFKQYGEISAEAEEIVRDMDMLGLDVLTALQHRAERTPSERFRDLISSIISTIRSGGDLRLLLHEEARVISLEHSLKIREYSDILSTIAEVYVMLLVATPLLLISMLAILNVIGGSIGKINLEDLMKILVYFALPFLNVIFILLVEATSP